MLPLPPRRRARPAARARRAAAGLLLRAHDADPVARRLAVRAARRRAAQVLRGRAARRRGARAGDRTCAASCSRDAARLDRRRGGRDRAVARAAGARRLRARRGRSSSALGGPRSIAVGPGRRRASRWRSPIAGRARRADAQPAAAGRASPRDGLALGLAQAAALIPGVSRNGATLTAARARGFSRGAAQALSWHAGLPVILGASVLEGVRMRRTGVAREQRAALRRRRHERVRSPRSLAPLLAPPAARRRALAAALRALPLPARGARARTSARSPAWLARTIEVA